MDVLYAMVKWRVSEDSCIRDVTKPQKGIRFAAFNVDTEPKKVAADLRKYLENEKKIDAWAQADPFSPFPIPFSRGDLRRICYEDCFIIILQNALSQPKVLEKLVEGPWRGQKGDLADRLKKRIMRLREKLGPSIVLPRPVVRHRR